MKRKSRILYEDDVIKAVDKHTNDDSLLDDDISCILEEVPSVGIVFDKNDLDINENNNYIFTSISKLHHGVICRSITAENEYEAFAKAYNYFGINGILNTEEFLSIIRNKSYKLIHRLFEHFTGETIIYFAKKPKECIIDYLGQINTEGNDDFR